MSLAASVLIGLGALAVVALMVFEVVHVYGEGGLRLFFWPKLSHGYEVAPVTRLAVAPWGLLLVVLVGNGVTIALFGHDLLGERASDYKPWLLSALVPLALIHLIDYRRSVVAAVVGLVLLAAVSAYLLDLYDAWDWLPLVALALLWSLNGVRAVHADRTMG
jgi:hypothetical protein